MERPLTALFVDCDSYFASVEQHLDPALRGRPVGVAPVMAESSCCIAASYEAKVFGVKTGPRISEARILCPGIAIVEAKPPEYLRFHHRVVAAVEDCIHVEAVLSIDEMWAWLPYNLRELAAVEAVGHRIKETVAREVSPVIKVSIGAGPNKYLAKIASKMRKPDGLLVIEHHQLPDILHPLELRELTGIGGSMEARLRAAGIRSVESLCAAGRPALRGAWGGGRGPRRAPLAPAARRGNPGPGFRPQVHRPQPRAAARQPVARPCLAGALQVAAQGLRAPALPCAAHRLAHRAARFPRRLAVVGRRAHGGNS